MEISNLLRFRTFLEPIVNALFWSVAAGLCLYKLYLASVVPFVVPFFSPHDGTWFFVTMLSMLNGDWMGTVYDNDTHFKGPVYSMFMAAMSQLGISFKLAIHLIYVVASLVFLFAIRKILNNRFALLIAFVMVLLNPITLSEFWAYPMRMNLYIPLILIYFSALIALIGEGFSKEGRFPLKWGILASCALALAWHTREESIWLVPALLPLAITTLYFLYKKPRQWPRLGIWVALILIPLSVSEILSGENDERYGFDGVVDFKLPQFNRAMNALVSLNTSESNSRISLDNKVRDKLIQISPNTKRLVALDDNGEPAEMVIVSTHVTWNIRHQMAFLGFYKDIESTEAEYKKIADDIAEFCRANEDQCRPTVLPGIITKSRYVKDILPKALNGLADFSNFERFSPPDRERMGALYGGENFKYAVSRSLNIPSLYNEERHLHNKLKKFESSRVKKIGKIHQFFNEYFPVFCILSLAGLLIVAIRKQYKELWVGMILAIGFSAGYTIYILLSVFVVDLLRIYAISLTPLICLVAVYCGLFLQNLGFCLKQFTTRIQARKSTA